MLTTTTTHACGHDFVRQLVHQWVIVLADLRMEMIEGRVEVGE